MDPHSWVNEVLRSLTLWDRQTDKRSSDDEKRNQKES
jgi:hypothetical protein